mmetsp:Transcript_35218/g.90524  ORF Transcript_35218/g.90524 Transcript_35218/m.90524 type:complete len:271 (+) Transcript_35218:522-1334(+)
MVVLLDEDADAGGAWWHHSARPTAFLLIQPRGLGDHRERQGAQVDAKRHLNVAVCLPALDVLLGDLGRVGDAVALFVGESAGSLLNRQEGKGLLVLEHRVFRRGFAALEGHLRALRRDVLRNRCHPGCQRLDAHAQLTGEELLTVAPVLVVHRLDASQDTGLGVKALMEGDFLPLIAGEGGVEARRAPGGGLLLRAELTRLQLPAIRQRVRACLGDDVRDVQHGTVGAIIPRWLCDHGVESRGVDVANAHVGGLVTRVAGQDKHHGVRKG